MLRILSSCALLILWTPSTQALGLQDPVPAQPRGGQSGASGAAGGLSREEMWYAPTEEDWKKPCLITWQRTYEDAVRVSEETDKPILVCVNMDGEIASEHYAGIRYRMPGIAELYAPYVCVIASVYRHTPRDYDEGGQRILCPRFGSVTCGEHIRIEPGLFDKFLDDTRVAPRHIMVENGTKEQYDVYYAFDTDSVFETIREGIANRPEPEPTVQRGDQSLVERVESRDVLDRVAVERAYLEGDRVLRRTLLERAAQLTELSQTDLLRLALFDTDAELARVAWQGLLVSSSPEAIDLISDVLRFELEPEDRAALIETLARIGDSAPRARRMANVHLGLSRPLEAFDFEAWRAALVAAGEPEPMPAAHLLQERAELAAQAREAAPEDAGAVLRAAAALYDLALHPDLEPRMSSELMRQARARAMEAAELGAEALEGGQWEVHSLLAATAKALGRNRLGYQAAELALRELPPDPTAWRAKETLALFAEARQRTIFRALVRKTDWPPAWLSDAHGAFQLLALHPHGSDRDVIEHHDYLAALEAKGYATRALDQSLERFPDSALLHDRLRARLLQEKPLDGLSGLEATYEAMLRDQDPATVGTGSNIYWYAGYASLVAAEFHRRGGGAFQARAAYARAIEHYESSIVSNPAGKDSADHYIALAQAGIARLDLEAREYESAIRSLAQSFERSPEAGDNLDGLGITPVMTATTLKARLAEAGREEDVARVQALLDDLPPEILEPPAFERVAPGTGEAGRRDLRRREAGRGRPGGRDRGDR
jgi:tetratricopeptide (TPR) repeat protein